MSRLVSRILLAILMIPAAVIVFIINALIIANLIRSYGYYSAMFEDAAITVCGLCTWAFVAVYWFLLWKGSVQWTKSRRVWTLIAFIGSILIASGIGSALNSLDRDVGNVMGPIIAALIWLIWVTFLWRETSTERAERFRAMNNTALVCPNCGYNLTGLQGTRCPECGTLYTLNEIIAAQPARVDTDIGE